MEQQVQTLPKSWIEVCIGDIALYVQRGKSPKYIEKSALPVINQKCIRWYGVDTQHVKYIHPDQWNSLGGERYLRDDDILWNSTGTGTIGRACLYNTKYFAKAVVDSHVTIVRCHKNISSQYVFYFIASPYVQKKIEDMQTGSTNQVELGRVAINQTVLPLPPLNEQKRIVDKIEMLFSDMDKGEENLRTAQRLLSSYRQSVLKAAVTGELTRDWREANKKNLESGEELLKRILKARREQWQGRGKYTEPTAPDTTNLPSLPYGWVWASPEQLANTEPNSLSIGPFGSNLKVSDYCSKGVPLIFVRHIRAKCFDGMSPQYVSAEKAEELSSHKIIGGDLLITKMGAPPGDVCIYPLNSPEAIITADCIRFSPAKKLLDLNYLELAIRSTVVQKQILGITKGVAQQKVTLGGFKKVGLPLPSYVEQQKIADITEDIFSRISALEAWCATELTRSNTLRQSILKSAFSGQLVPQDANDEPASELLKRIVAERDTTSKQKPAKRGRSGKQEAA